MKVVLFGASGMVGQAALRECLLTPAVDRVVCVGRSAPAASHQKLEQLVHADLFDLGPVADHLAGYDACIYSIGVTSLGTSGPEYARTTRDLTLEIARCLLAKNPGMRFVFISAKGADSSTRGPVRWARVKGETENALFAMPFVGCTVIRPAGIEPMDGIESRTRLYRHAYALGRPVLPLLRRLAPHSFVTTRQLGRVIVDAALHATGNQLLEGKSLTRSIDRSPERHTV